MCQGRGQDAARVRWRALGTGAGTSRREPRGVPEVADQGRLQNAFPWLAALMSPSTCADLWEVLDRAGQAQVRSRGSEGHTSPRLARVGRGGEHTYTEDPERGLRCGRPDTHTGPFRGYQGTVNLFPKHVLFLNVSKIAKRSFLMRKN